MDMNEIIERINYFRNKRNLSARELSFKIDKNGAYINQVEYKNFTISLPALFDIINALEISGEEFFSADYRNYNQDNEILDILNSLSSDRKKAFIDLMKNTK